MTNIMDTQHKQSFCNINSLSVLIIIIKGWNDFVCVIPDAILQIKYIGGSVLNPLKQILKGGSNQCHGICKSNGIAKLTGVACICEPKLDNITCIWLWVSPDCKGFTVGYIDGGKVG